LRLEAIQISGFRSFASPTKVLVGSQMTAFIGENDGGKTACLDAIHFLLGDYSPIEDDYTKSAGGSVSSITVEGWFRTTSEDEHRLLAEASTPSTEILHVIVVATRSGSPVRTMERNVPADPRLNVDLSAMIVANLKEFATHNGVDVSSCQRKESYVMTLTDWLQSQPHSLGSGSLPKQIQERFPSLVSFDSADAIDPEQTIFKLLRQYAEDEMEKEKYTQSVKRIESGIRTELGKQSRSLEKVIKKYNPDIVSAKVEPQFRVGSWLASVSLVLSERDGQPIPLDRRGEGKRRKVTLGVHEWSSGLLANRAETQHDLIFALDEPDTHLDYGAQRQLYEVLKQYCKNGIQVVVCTHSLNLINRMSLTDLVYFQLDEQLHSTVKGLVCNNDDPDTVWTFVNQVGSSMGLDNATMFHERCFLIVEGATEMNALPALFRICYGDLMQSYGIKLIDGESSGSARCLAKFLNNNRKKVVFLLDNDCSLQQETTPNRVFSRTHLVDDGFDVTQQVVFVGNKEFEDAFSDATLARLATTLNRQLTSASAKRRLRELRQDANSDQDCKFSQKFAGGICGTSKPQMGKGLGQLVKHKNEVPEAIRRVFEIAVSTANGH